MSITGEQSLNDKLRLAACKGDVETIKQLVPEGAQFDVDKYGRTALHYASHYGMLETAKQCVALGCSLDIQDNYGCTALHRSVVDGHVEVVKTLLHDRCSVEKQDENGNTALHEAAWNGYSQTVDALVKVGKSNIHAVNKNGQKPIHLSVQNGHNESTRLLLKAGTHPDVKNQQNNETPLHIACLFGHVTCARILISAGCTLHAQNGAGNTPLHIASGLGKKKIVRLLLEAGCSTRHRNNNQQTALELARNNGHSDIILLILSAHKLRKGKLSTFFSRKKKHFSDESRDGSVMSSSFADYKDSRESETFDVGSSSPRIKGRREMKEDGKVDDKDTRSPKKDGKRPRDSDSKDGRASRSSREGRKRREKSKDRDAKTIDSKVSQNSFVKDELRKKIDKEKTTQHQVHFGRMMGNPQTRVQYYRDKNGKILEVPMSATCNCAPYIRKLENQVEATKEGVLHEIELTRAKFESRLRGVDRRMDHQAQCLDKLNRERLSAERTECLHRIDRRAQEERALIQEEQEARAELVEQEMKRWFEERIQPLHEQLSRMVMGHASHSGEGSESRDFIYQDSGVSLQRSRSETSLSDMGRGSSHEDQKHKKSGHRRQKIEKSELKRHLSAKDLVQAGVDESYLQSGARPKERMKQNRSLPDGQNYEEAAVDGQTRWVTAPDPEMVSGMYRPPLISAEERDIHERLRVERPSVGVHTESETHEDIRQHSQGYLMSNHISDQSSNDETYSDSDLSDSDESVTQSAPPNLIAPSQRPRINGNGGPPVPPPRGFQNEAHLTTSGVTAAVASSQLAYQHVQAASKKAQSAAGSYCSSSGISSARSASLVSSAHSRQLSPYAPSIPHHAPSPLASSTPPVRPQFSVPVEVHSDVSGGATNWRNRARQVSDVPPPSHMSAATPGHPYPRGHMTPHNHRGQTIPSGDEEMGDSESGQINPNARGGHRTPMSSERPAPSMGHPMSSERPAPSMGHPMSSERPAPSMGQRSPTKKSDNFFL